MNLTPQPAPAPPTTIFASGECGNCGTYIGLFIHNVRLRGIQRKLCTSCVLRLHPSSFCPICFTFYDSNPPHPSKRLSCAKCGSFTHSHCAKPLALSSPYHCPPCSDPKNFNFFKNHPAKSTNTDPNPNTTGNMRSDDDKNAHVIDSKSAAVLLCAARIAAASMEKAVLVARIEEEKKAKEAAAARKRAREALEHVGVLIINHLKPTLDVTRKDQIQSLCELPCNIQDTRELLATTKLQLHNLVPQAMSLPRPSRKPQLKPSTLDLRLPVPRLIQLKRNARLRRLRSKSHLKGAISLTNTTFDSFTLNQY
ncbi:uncharacterized protein LOC123201820 [Mangifera indica]|uniref:uncharacterized protein LOC123201820 n=1 Tax=Mangifera indica TaxID=29780 RepID=UPI001CFA6CD8|nr:uncharacterized protein LOC123201820 [Mangifera indica]